VLEIGTGSGYSAALMSHIVGQRGHVLTMDNDEDLSKRADAPFAEHGHRAIAATGTGLMGHPGRAPHDRIFVGGTPAPIPAAWLDQLAPGGVVVTGCLVSDLPGTYAVAHIVKAADGPRVTVQAGRYPLMGVPVVPPTVTVVTGEDDSRYYLATTSPDRAAAEQFLKVLRTAHAEPWPGTRGELLDLRNWLLARQPVGLFTAKTLAKVSALRSRQSPATVMLLDTGVLPRPSWSLLPTTLHALLARLQRSDWSAS
jgi:hypothetical protein